MSITSIGKGGAYGLRNTENFVSNPSIDFAGIGEGVLSYKPDNRKMEGSGTSFAAAHVTGFIAALLGKKKEEDEGINNATPNKGINSVTPRKGIEAVTNWKGKEKKSVNDFKELLTNNFAIDIQTNLGGKTAVGNGFLTFLEKEEFEKKIEGYVTSCYENWDGIEVVNAFFEDLKTNDKKLPRQIIGTPENQ